MALDAFLDKPLYFPVAAICDIPTTHTASTKQEIKIVYTPQLLHLPLEFQAWSGQKNIPHLLINILLLLKVLLCI